MNYRDATIAAALVGLLAAAAVAVGVATLNEVPVVSRSSLAIAGILAPPYVLGLVLATLPAIAIARLVPALLPLGPIIQITVVALMAFLFASSLLRMEPEALLLPIRSSVLYAVPTVLATAAVLAGRGRTTGRRLTAIGIAILAASAIGLSARRLPRGASTRGEPSPRPAAVDVSVASRVAAHPLLVIGFDGLDPEILTLLMDRGELPHFASLAAAGARGPAETLYPTYSPSIWTTIATGKPPREHGVLGFGAWGAPGVPQPLQRVPFHTGCGHLFQWFNRIGFFRFTPASATLRRTSTIWEVLANAGRRVGVVNWWASWPATPLDGVIVTDQFQYALESGRPGHARGLVHPDTLFAPLAALAVRAADVDERELARVFEGPPRSGEDRRIDTWARRFLASDITYMRVAHELLERSRYDFFAVYLRGVDSLTHLAGEYSDLFGRAPGERRYRRALTEAYRRADEQLGELLSLVRPDTNVIVCSDHGFEWQRDGHFHHTYAPSGVVMLRGPDAAAGKQIRGAHVLDLAPTLLYLSGQPLALDMAGSVLLDALRPGSLREFGYVSTYDPLPRESRLPADQGDANVIEQLRALGYIR